MNKVKYLSLVCFICLIFSSCAVRGYTDTLSCADIANELIEEISPSNDYKAFREEEISFLLDENIDYDDCCFMYSSASDDISEIAVFHSNNPDVLFDDISKYAESIRKDKRSFVENYIPDELDKLNDGQARRFGNYVILAIFEKSERDKIFEASKKILSKK